MVPTYLVRLVNVIICTMKNNLTVVMLDILVVMICCAIFVSTRVFFYVGKVCLCVGHSSFKS